MSSKIPTGALFPLARAKTKEPKAPRPAPLKKSPAKKPAAKAELPAALPPEPGWQEAVAAAEEKQAREIRVLDLRDVTSFSDFFVVCNGTNIRQNQAIANEIELSLKKLGRPALSIEGYTNAEWILMDYGDFLVHIFTEKARQYYDLERLWRDAKILTV